MLRLACLHAARRRAANRSPSLQTSPARLSKSRLPVPRPSFQMHDGDDEQTVGVLAIDNREREAMHKEALCSSLIFRPGIRGFSYSGDGSSDFVEERPPRDLAAVRRTMPWPALARRGLRDEIRGTVHRPCRRRFCTSSQGIVFTSPRSICPSRRCTSSCQACSTSVSGTSSKLAINCSATSARS